MRLSLLILLALAPPLAAADSPLRVTRVRLHPRPGHAERLVGGRVTGSNSSATTDFRTLAEVKKAGDGWLTLPIPDAPVYRFVKFESPNGGWGNLAEVEFYHGDAKLAGTPFGTNGSRDDAGNTFVKALDGDVTTYFDGVSPNGQYVGLDLGEAAQAAAPTLAPPSGRSETPVTLTMATATPGAEIRYTLDGSTPSATRGTPYTRPVRLEKSAVVVAVATEPSLGDSQLTVGAYNVGRATGREKVVSSFHIGNSLTDTVDGWLEPLARSAGHDYHFYRFTIPGAPTDWLWDHPGSGFGDSRYREAFLARAPLTHVLTQPFAGHDRSIDNEAKYSGQFFAAAREHSPDAQCWLYAQWPGREFSDNWSRGTGSTKPLKLKPAATWQEAVANHLAYTEAVRGKLGTLGNQPVRIVPAGSALAELKTRVEAGQVPGITDFFAEHFSDDLHLSAKGRYLVALVHYACLVGESPEGKVTAANTGLTPEQAKLYQRLAWDVARGTRHSGLGAK